MQQEIVANREERKQRFAAFLRLQYERSMRMLQAGHGQGPLPDEDQIADLKEERNLQDISLFLYRLDSDFEDKKRRLEKMLFNHPVRLKVP